MSLDTLKDIMQTSNLVDVNGGLSSDAALGCTICSTSCQAGCGSGCVNGSVTGY
jgi:hypothetical protein